MNSSRTRVAGPGLVVGRRRRRPRRLDGPSGLGGPSRRDRPSRLDRPPRRTYPLKWVVVALAVTALVLFGGPWLFIYLFEGSTPGRLTLPSASGVPKGPLQPGPISGTWVISAGSVVGYRVPEVLFGTSHTAVGRTDQVSGGMVVSGTEVTAADFTVEVATIHSDQAARDYQFRNGIMDTADHPHASFRLTAPIQLGTIPLVGRIVTFTAQGDLNLRGVTRAIRFPLSAERLSATSIDINAEIPISFPEWHIPNPSLAAGYVAQVADHGTLEVLLHLTPAPPPAAH